MADRLDQGKHWADIGESTTVLGIQILLFAYRLGGNWLFRVFLAPVIVCYFLFESRARQASLKYLSILHASDTRLPAPNWSNSFRIFWSFGLALIDKFAVWMGKITRDDVVIHGNDYVEQQLAKKQGAVLLLSHVGNFEICHALSQSHPGVKLTVLVHTHNAERFNELLQRFSDHQTIELLQVSEMNISSSIVLSERAARGEFIAIAGDRVPLSSEATCDVEFLGRPAALPLGPVVLATALCVPILMLTCIKPQSVYHIHFDKLSDGERVPRAQRQQHYKKLVEDYATRLQAYVQQVPFQWFNFYDFWRTGEQISASLEAGRR